MIPTETQAKALWDKYHLPQRKRLHVTLVAKVALFLARKCQTRLPDGQVLNAECQINEQLLLAGALLHDIDKNAPKLPGEQHPDTAIRILREEGMEEVAALVATHPLHAILDPAIGPKTWAEKVLYLADKMVKYNIIGVDERFRLWNEERLPPQEQKILDATYPKVKALEKEVFNVARLTPDTVAKFVQEEYTSDTFTPHQPTRFAQRGRRKQRV